MAARLKKNNKSRVNQEPRSAHGRAVKKLKKINPVKSKNRARPMAARLKNNIIFFFFNLQILTTYLQHYYNYKI